MKTGPMTEAEAALVATLVAHEADAEADAALPPGRLCGRCTAYVPGKEGVGTCHAGPPAVTGASAFLTSRQWPPVDPKKDFCRDGFEPIVTPDAPSGLVTDGK